MSRRLYETWGRCSGTNREGHGAKRFRKSAADRLAMGVIPKARVFSSEPRDLARSAEMRGEKEVGTSTASAVPPYSIMIRALPTDGSASLPA